jgi:hypothetical protein
VYDTAVNAAYVTAHPRTSCISANARGFRLWEGQDWSLEAAGGGTQESGFTDNTAALNELCALVYDPSAGLTADRLYASPRATIRMGVGIYPFLSLIELHNPVHISGQYAGGNTSSPNGTRWWFPKAQGALIVQHTSTSGRSAQVPFGTYLSASGAIIEGIRFEGQGTSTDRTQHCIQLRTRATLRNNIYLNAAGDAEHIVGYTDGGGIYGEVNSWISDNCAAQDCFNGQFVQGSDVNAGRSIGFQTHQTIKGCAIFNRSYFTNTFLPGNLAGYGNTGVYNAGLAYALSSPFGGDVNAPGSAGATGVWDLLGPYPNADQYFAQWVNGGDYYIQAPIYDGGSAGSVYLAPYVETGIIPSIVSAPALIIGGTIVSDHSSAICFDEPYSEAMNITKGVGRIKRYATAAGAYASVGAFFYDVRGASTANNPNNAPFRLRETNSDRLTGSQAICEDVQDGCIVRYQSGGKTIEWETPSRFNSVPTIQAYASLGRKTPQQNVKCFPRLAIGSGDLNTAHRTLTYATASPTSGDFAQGDFLFNTAPALSGVFGWSCTKSGAVASTAWGYHVYYVGDLVLNDTGKSYICKVAGLSATTGGPTGTGSNIADGSVRWDYCPTPFQFAAVAVGATVTSGT